MNKPTMILLIGVGAYAWGIAAATAEPRTDSTSDGAPWLRLRSGPVDTSTQPVLPVSAPRDGAERYVIQLARPINGVLRSRLERAGVRLSSYLPDNAYVVRLEGTSPRIVSELDGVRWIDRFRAEWKLAPDIGRRYAAGVPDAAADGKHGTEGTKATALERARRRLARTGKVQVTLSLFAGEDLQSTVTRLRHLETVEVLAAHTASGRGIIDAVVELEALGSIAAIEAVQFTEEAPVGTLRNTTTRWVVQSNVSSQTPLWNEGLHGEGQIAGLIDSEVRLDHCAFEDVEPVGPTHRKVVAYRGESGAHPHGTHTAGTLAGDQGTRGDADPVDGMAFAARLSFSLFWDLFATPSMLYPYLSAAHQDGARVHSNSWGDDGATTYTTWCEQADRFSRDYEDSLVIFATTNTSTLKTPENAKNVLAIGATYQAPSQESRYSGGSGPTADGRRKPEVFAPGWSILSASSYDPCGTRTSSGTSMAAPAVAGMAVLARQYYTEGFYPSGVATPGDTLTPTGALLKATVVNSAVDMVDVADYPSDAEGWGRVLMDETLHFVGDSRGLFIADVRNADGLSTGEFETFHINIIDDAEPLKITAVFTDVPGTVGAEDPVVNDLDLIVTGPLGEDSGGAEYLGNHFVGGESAPGGVRDARNNVEQVHLSSPQPGLYTIEVRGAAVNENTQGYALVATGVLESTDPPAGCGDYDYDGDVDLADFAALQRCFTDVDNGPIHAECQPLDLDGDRDVDAADVAAFHQTLTGP